MIAGSVAVTIPAWDRAPAQGVKRVLLQGYGAFVPVDGGLLVNDGWAAGGLLGVATLPLLRYLLVILTELGEALSTLNANIAHIARN